MKLIIPSFAALAALSACAVPNSPTVTATDVDRAFAEGQFISNLPETSVGDLPSGRVTYTGQVGANVTGDAVGGFLGDMSMNVDFARNDVGGRISNINLIDADGTPNQRFDGNLTIDGSENRGALDAFAYGEISGVDIDDDAVKSQVVLTLDGAVHDDLGRGDAVFGSATGEANGDFYLDIDGVFFGTAD